MTPDGAVYELTEHGSRLLYPAGSPEAEAFHAKYGDPDHPVDLSGPEPVSPVQVPAQSDEVPS